ncbi:MAG: DUF3592 domain-containing protein [Lentisphaerae bacterium]|nr:DUF3592 domain-containing protein [Lentisphaerota bacterium]MCP4100099.1 DUF3592 domain-containing protein [Lentisphaerota bacterium]
MAYSKNLPKQSSFGSNLFASLFFFVFFVAGLSFIFFMGKTLYESAVCLTWSKTPCVIVTSKVTAPASSKEKYGLAVEYQYCFSKKIYTSNQVSKSSKQVSYKKAVKFSQNYYPGAKTHCYVDPNNPKDAVLIKRVDWLLLPFMLIPLIFVLVGLGGIYGIWHKSKSKKENDIPNPNKYVFMRKYGICFFFLIFLIVGIAFGYFMFLRPALKVFDAADWPRVPCKVISSRVTVNADNDSTTYGIEVIYKYFYQGTEYTSDKWDFMGGYSSGYQAKKTVVNKYSPGCETTCFVNPAEPDVAVLNREFYNGYWFGIIPLLFVLVGIGGIAGTVIRQKRKDLKRLVHNGIAGIPDRTDNDSGETILKPENGPLKSFLGSLVVAIIWNGIVAISVYKFFNGYESKSIDWVLLIVVIIFGIAGLVILGIAIYHFIILFNARPVFRINSSFIQMSDKTEISWEIPAGRNISMLEVFIEGHEIVTVNKGKNSSQEDSIFYSEKVFSTDLVSDIICGEKSFFMPDQTMHSFETKCGKIVWMLRVHGDIKSRPDINFKYKINLLPAEFKMIVGGV